MDQGIASLGVLAIVALGFYIMVGGYPRRRMRGSGPLTERAVDGPRFAPGAVRDTVNALVTVGMVTGFFARSAASTLDAQSAAVGIVVVLAGLAVIPDLQVLVGIAALVILFLDRALAGPMLLAFVCGGIVHMTLRKALGR